MLRVITPSRNDDLCDRMLGSLERSEPGSAVRVIVGDNGLSREFRRAWPQVQYVEVPRDPFTSPAAYNLLAEAAGNSDLFALSDDVEILSPDWLSFCEVQFRYWPRSYGQINLQGDVGFHESDHTLAFIATLIPRSIWTEIGPLDPRYTGYGFDDTDLNLRMLHAGYRLGECGTIAVRHEGSVTWERALGGWDAVRRACEPNFHAFYDKWKLPRPDPPTIETFWVTEHLNRAHCLCAKEVA